jgi:hypothetical protein
MAAWSATRNPTWRTTPRCWCADATLTGALRENAWLDAGYAAGYQFRHLDVSARPSGPADLSINPCLVPGDRSCIDESGRYIGSGAGPFTLTNGYFPYEEYQGLHRRHDEIERGEESHFVSGQRHRRFLRSGGHRACAVNRVS